MSEKIKKFKGSISPIFSNVTAVEGDVRENSTSVKTHKDLLPIDKIKPRGNQPRKYFDAAAIDGCSNFQILWRIVFHIALPAIITLIIINSLYVWYELLIALIFLQSDSQKTLMAGISTFKGLYNVNIPAVMAGIFLATVPMIIIYIIGSSNFIKGILAGSVTGE